jgi:hypothetical protein
MQSVPITTDVVGSNPAQGGATLCGKVCQWLAAGQWFSPGTLLKVALNTIKLKKQSLSEIQEKFTKSTITKVFLFFFVGSRGDMDLWEADSH